MLNEPESMTQHQGQSLYPTSVDSLSPHIMNFQQMMGSSSPRDSVASNGSSVNDNNNGESASGTEDAYNDPLVAAGGVVNNMECPMCHVDDFTTKDALEMHIHGDHPDFHMYCHKCGQMFGSLQMFYIHFQQVHAESAIGSSNASHIKRAITRDHHHQQHSVVDTNVPTTKVSLLHYLFNKNNLNNALGHHHHHHNPPKSLPIEDFHQRSLESGSLQESATDDVDVDMDENMEMEMDQQHEIEETKSHFLAGLNFPNGGEDASMSKNSEAPSHEDESVGNAAMIDSENDDPFISEMRDMKRRGEFPCRLCPQTFRNLRALKGHARVHYAGTKGASHYQCNICVFATSDKTAVIKHIRGHSGDHPYQCMICMSTFTTKANCERHLRNAHKKTTREEIKKSLIDRTNGKQVPNANVAVTAANSKSSLQGLLAFALPKAENNNIKGHRNSFSSSNKGPNSAALDYDLDGKSATMDRHSDSEESNHSNDSNNNGLLDNKPNSYHSNRQHRTDSDHPRAGGALLQRPYPPDLLTIHHQHPQHPQHPPYIDFIPPSVAPIVKSHLEDHLDAEIKSSNHQHHQSTDEPLDLSVDVLDLSKKKPSSSTNSSNVLDLKVSPATVSAEDLTFKPNQLPTPLNSNIFMPLPSPVPNQPGLNSLVHPLLSLPPASETEITLPFIPTPLHLPPIFSHHQKMPMFPLSQGSPSFGNFKPGPPPMIPIHGTDKTPKFFLNHLDPFLPSHIPLPGFANPKMEKPPALPEDKIPLPPSSVAASESKKEGGGKEKPQSAQPKQQAKNKSSSVKMIMVNGVLVEKQKQKRYRTEKPFSCDHCNGRFTLRSNMDRHVKQQHPGCWKQRQRGGSSRLHQRRSKDESPSSIGHRTSSPMDMDHSETSSVDMPMIMMPVDVQIKTDPDASSLPDSDVDTEYKNIDIEYKNVDIKYRYESQSPTNDAATEFADQNDGRTYNSSSISIKYEEDENDAADEDEDEDLIIDEESNESSPQVNGEDETPMPPLKRVTVAPEGGADQQQQTTSKRDENHDLASVESLLDNASNVTFRNIFRTAEDDSNKHSNHGYPMEEDEEGLIGPGSSSEGNASGDDERFASNTKSVKNEDDDLDESTDGASRPKKVKKKSAYSSAPNRVLCKYCSRTFPWNSSLRRHVLTHTKQKPYKCPKCAFWFTTKSNRDRHYQRKHKHTDRVSTIQQRSAPHQSRSTRQRSASESGAEAAPRIETSSPPEILPYAAAVNNACPNVPFGGGAVEESPPPPRLFTSTPKRKAAASSPNLLRNKQGAGFDSKKTFNFETDREVNAPGGGGGGGESMVDVDEPPGPVPSMTSTERDYRRKFSSGSPTSGANETAASGSASGNLSGGGGGVANELPSYKCHLCEHSCSERSEALDHVKSEHAKEFQLLVKKGAFDRSVKSEAEYEDANSQANAGQSDDNSSMANVKCKSPDHSNRKVMCVCCEHRFWSTEDLRRHMRTHTGERPFNCDICRKPFTLKHSMLRHRKMHSNSSKSPTLGAGCGSVTAINSSGSGASGENSPCRDDEMTAPTPAAERWSTSPYANNDVDLTTSARNHHHHHPYNRQRLPHHHHRNRPPFMSVESLEKALLMGESSSSAELDKSELGDARASFAAAKEDDGDDLIAKLLDIKDEGFVDTILTKSADQVAKLLGVEEKKTV